MPVGYLVTVASVAAGTLFALIPVRRPRPLATLAYRLGLLVNELPFVSLAWLLLWAANAFTQGDVHEPAGWTAAAVAAATAAGLPIVVRRALRARPVVEHALAEGLGPSWRAAIAPDTTAGLRRRHPLARILLRPFPRRPRTVTRVPNLAYGPAGRRHRLDVLHHRSRPDGAPLLIHLHGGAYHGGRKNSESMPLLHRLAGRGWVCVSANYRLRPEVQHPEHLIDLKRVIAWTRDHAHAYGADPATLFVAGSSAGAHMASLAALTAGDPALQPGFETADTSVTAVIGLNGYYGPYYGQGPESCPSTHVTADAPPFLLVHGDHDTIVPVTVARRFADDLRAVSAGPVVYAELPGAQHAFDLFHSLRNEAVVDAVEAFAAWVRSDGRVPEPPCPATDRGRPRRGNPAGEPA